MKLMVAYILCPEPSYHHHPLHCLCAYTPNNNTANHIQRIKRESPLNELQPPPYQNTPERLSHSGSRTRSGRGGRGGGEGRGSSPERCSSEASVDQDTESYLNKGYDEDVPSDSTAVLGPEVRSRPLTPPHVKAMSRVEPW